MHTPCTRHRATQTCTQTTEAKGRTAGRQNAEHPWWRNDVNSAQTDSLVSVMPSCASRKVPDSAKSVAPPCGACMLPRSRATLTERVRGLPALVNTYGRWAEWICDGARARHPGPPGGPYIARLNTTTPAVSWSSRLGLILAFAS